MAAMSIRQWRRACIDANVSTRLAPMPDNPNPKRPHNLEDHLHGRDYDHRHDGDEAADHDHDHYEADGRLEDNALWIQDHVSRPSVRIDIGSSRTQVIFSRIN